MTIFKRGIKNNDFLIKLNNLYSDKNSFWHKMVNDKDLFIAIRDEYLNVYYKGQNLCKLSFRNGLIKGETHKTYLGGLNQGYFISKNGLISNKKAKIKNLSELDSIKENIKNCIGKEKRESYKEVLDDKNCVIDVEITLVRNKVLNPKNQSDYEISSIDYLSLEMNKLVFYEAKHFSNSEIRSKTSPKVFKQIDRYKRELHNHKIELLNSYKVVLQNLKDLKLLKKQLDIKGLEIDINPNLIVFGIDKNESEDSHLQKLRNRFGKRLILKYKR